MTKWKLMWVCIAFVAAAGQAMTVSAWAANTKHQAATHTAAKKSPYAQQCAAIWPQFLAADIADGDFADDPMTPADIANSKQVFFQMCLSRGPDIPEIQGMLH